MPGTIVTENIGGGGKTNEILILWISTLGSFIGEWGWVNSRGNGQQANN